MKTLFAVVVFLALACGGMIALARHDIAAQSDSHFRQYRPVTASFSRFRGDSQHLISIYYRLHFPDKKPPLREAVAFWSLKPFRHVSFMTK